MVPSAGIPIFHSLGKAVKAANALGIKNSAEKLVLLKKILLPKRDIPRYWLRTAPKSGFITRMEQPLSEMRGVRGAIFKLQKYGLNEKKCRHICKAVFRKNASALGSRMHIKHLDKEIVSRRFAEYFRIAGAFGFTPTQAARLTSPDAFILVLHRFDAEKTWRDLEPESMKC